MSGTITNNVSTTLSVESGYQCCAGCAEGVAKNTSLFFTDANGTWTLTGNACSATGFGIASRNVGQSKTVSCNYPVIGVDHFHDEQIADTPVSGSVHYFISVTWLSSVSKWQVAIQFCCGSLYTRCTDIVPGGSGTETAPRVGFFCPGASFPSCTDCPPGATSGSGTSFGSAAGLSTSGFCDGDTVSVAGPIDMSWDYGGPAPPDGPIVSGSWTLTN